MAKRAATKSNNFKEIDDQYAYSIWILEKEFNVGPITDEFLLMKFWNLLDNDNIDRYNQSMKGKKGSKGITTFG